MRILNALILILTSFACSSVPKALPPAVSQTEVTVSRGDPRVGSYVSSWRGFRTSSYWIEGPTGLILIDTQFLPSESTEMVEQAEKITGKKTLLAIVLHSNPDKFNGTRVYQKRGIRVVTSAQVLSHIPAVHKLRTEWFYNQYKPDYPSETPAPESFGSQDTELSAGGITVKARVLGKGCSEAHVVVEFDHNVFVGDLATIGFHSWLELGYLDEWQKSLVKIQAMKPQFVRTGRGGTGGPEVLDREMRYLQTVQKIAHDLKIKHRKSELNDQLSERLLREIMAKYPAYEYPAFVENGLEAIWKNVRL